MNRKKVISEHCGQVSQTGFLYRCHFSFHADASRYDAIHSRQGALILIFSIWRGAR
ncbi:hypothetical protein [Neisseria sicca]|uniref:hypothetical protein n=1 Tax=Neisseria sicca TaxID=490 RepID=UPI001649E6F4|nr:hypothetical protein [Neisseria sicca]